MPPVRFRNDTREKPAAATIAAKRLLARKRADAFDQVAIGRAIAGHDLADGRDGRQGVDVVQRLEPRQIGARKFEATEPAARLQHPVGFRKRALDVRHVADAEGNRIAIEMALGKRQRLGIGRR